jgi:hypothetical protein
VSGGWTLYQYPGLGVADIGNNSAKASYYTWVDQHNTLGLGTNVPISTGNENDALLALVNGKWVVLRGPHLLSFYAKGTDGRIDDPNAGWKGRRVWTTSGDRTLWLNEGKGTVPIALFSAAPQPARRLMARAAGPFRNPRSAAKEVLSSRGRTGINPIHTNGVVAPFLEALTIL